MYQEWPFFQSTIDLIEMILSKCDMRIASMYDAVLAETEEEKALGVVLRGKFDDTVKAILEVRCQLRYVHCVWAKCGTTLPVSLVACIMSGPNAMPNGCQMGLYAVRLYIMQSAVQLSWC